MLIDVTTDQARQLAAALAEDAAAIRRQYIAIGREASPRESVTARTDDLRITCLLSEADDLVGRLSGASGTHGGDDQHPVDVPTATTRATIADTAVIVYARDGKIVIDELDLVGLVADQVHSLYGDRDRKASEARLVGRVVDTLLAHADNDDVYLDRDMITLPWGAASLAKATADAAGWVDDCLSRVETWMLGA